MLFSLNLVLFYWLSSPVQQLPMYYLKNTPPCFFQHVATLCQQHSGSRRHGTVAMCHLYIIDQHWQSQWSVAAVHHVSPQTCEQQIAQTFQGSYFPFTVFTAACRVLTVIQHCPLMNLRMPDSFPQGFCVTCTSQMQTKAALLVKC